MRSTTLKANLEKIMAHIDKSVSEEADQGSRSDDWPCKTSRFYGKHLVTTLDTYHGYPGTAEETEFRAYRDCILELSMHHDEDYAFLRGKKKYSIP